jgi:hypothetical protein
VAGATLGTSGSSSSTLSSPSDVYIGNNSAFYVLDAGNYRIQRFLSNSIIGTTVLNSSYGTGLNQFASSKLNIIWGMSIYSLFSSE